MWTFWEGSKGMRPSYRHAVNVGARGALQILNLNDVLGDNQARMRTRYTGIINVNGRVKLTTNHMLARPQNILAQYRPILAGNNDLGGGAGHSLSLLLISLTYS